MVLLDLFVDVVILIILGGGLCVGIVLVVPSVVRWMW